MRDYCTVRIAILAKALAPRMPPAIPGSCRSIMSTMGWRNSRQTASAFPQNGGYNPTGTVGALTYWAVDAIKKRYLNRPGPLAS